MAKNQFAKPCYYCKKMVMPFQGNLWKMNNEWLVAHPECAENAMKSASVKKEDIRIEYPSRGATYCENCYGVYKYGLYPSYSVLSGQVSRTFVDRFDTLEEAVQKYPDAQVLNHSCYQTTIMPSFAPDWFDPLDAGEEW